MQVTMSKSQVQAIFSAGRNISQRRRLSGCFSVVLITTSRSGGNSKRISSGSSVVLGPSLLGRKSIRDGGNETWSTSKPRREFLGLGSLQDFSNAQEEIERRFLALSIIWKSTSTPSSSVESLTSHPAYLQVIALGVAAIPAILADLARSPDHWFVALEAITGHDPVLDHERGDITAMANSWISWGVFNGFVRKA